MQLSYGGIDISATQAGGNTAAVSYTNSSHSMIEVYFNGQTEDFDTSVVGPICTVTYSGDQHGQGGSDYFANFTSLTDSVAMYGGNNTVIGGSGYNFIMVTDGNNNVTAGSGGGMVFDLRRFERFDQRRRRRVRLRILLRPVLLFAVLLRAVRRKADQGGR